MLKLFDEVESVLNAVAIDFGGGCSASKAHVIAYLISHFKSANALDIGVYRGRSFLPMCVAMRENGNGVAHAVDPWSKTEAVEKDNHRLRAEIDQWIERLDFEAVYRSVVENVHAHGLDTFARIHRTTSRNAAALFSSLQISFDLIHIDGNHDTDAVLADVDTYLPLLAEGGICILDDISWTSVRPAVERVLATCRVLMWRVTAHPEDDYAVFVKPPVVENHALAQQKLLSIAGDGARFEDGHALRCALDEVTQQR
jgi:predicted O-methyltransferase YrrM